MSSGCFDQSYAERQCDEMQILESIFGDQLFDVRKNDVWKVSRPPEFILKLQPQESMSQRKQVHVHVEMKVKLPSRYPDCEPVITFQNPHGLSSDAVSHMEEEISKLSKVLVGEVMVLQLAQFVQEFLHKHNIRQFTSVYEEMVLNQQKQMEREAKEEEKKREIQRRREEKQRKEIEEELARREEEEKKLRKLKREEKDAMFLTERTRRSSSSASFEEENSQKYGGVVQVKFTGKIPRAVNRGRCLGKDDDATLFVGMDSSSGELMVIRHVEIPCRIRAHFLTSAERARVDKCVKNINTIEQELQSLVKLSNKHVAAYYAMKTTFSDEHIDIDVLQEYAHGICLEQKLASKERVALDTLRHYTEQMLLAIDYLHKKSVVHKNFKASSVFLDSSGLIKVADYSIGKRLIDLCAENKTQQQSVRFSEDRIPPRLTKKGDILRLGMVVLSLAAGHTVTDYPPEISSNFPAIFRDFLEKCLVVEDRLRLSASELLEHDFIKSVADTSCLTSTVTKDEQVLEEQQNDVLDYLDNEASAVVHSNKPTQLSRLHSEFEELDWLGKGGYGDVVKVRNKLDDRLYAIKRIHLNPHLSQFNKKIIREVKLLSRLNHENVVRYYNSWIETMQRSKDDLSTSSSSNLNTTIESKPDFSKNSLGLSDDIEKMAPPPVHSSTSEWSVSLEDVSRRMDEDDDDDDDEDMFKTIYVDEDESESILFEHDENESTEEVSEESGKKDTATSPSVTIDGSDTSCPLITQRFLYIQMEYCEKSTLRDTIDAGLGRDKERMWRLFREILEGLVHVHHQGMIHRDLKPQNIFLDKNDHVKIGDFGLATAHSRGMVAETMDDTGSKSDTGDSMLTGVVGTALYVAPELLAAGKRTLYSQKVDMYSVGIIFFEMAHSNLLTKMERVKVLGNLRTPNIRFPSDFDESVYHREAEITRWCLSHDPTGRPTAAELLKCRLVPTPALEEANVLDAVREMLSDPRSKPHRLVIDEVFDQADDRMSSVLYDIDLKKRPFSLKSSVAQQQTHDKVSSILRRHGAVRVNTSLLLPKHGTEMDNIDAAVFVDNGGTIVTLPYNLRVPFVRFVSYSGVASVKRYAIEKVYRARKIKQSRPKEMWECSFDIVTPTPGNMLPDAEVVYGVAEIIASFPMLASQKYEIRINHTRALRAVFTHCGIEDQHHSDALTALANCGRRSSSQVETCLSGLAIGNQQLSSLISFTQVHGPFAKVQCVLRTISRNKHAPASAIAREAVHDLETIKKHLDVLQTPLPVVFDLGLVHKYHEHYSGVMFQVCAEVQKKKGSAIDTIAVGGRYDKLLETVSYLKMGTGEVVGTKDIEAKSSQTCAVGVSIAIEKVVASVLSDSQATSASTTFDANPGGAATRHSPVDVLVCAIGRSSLLQERMKIVKSLWDAGISAETPYDRNVETSVQELQERAHQRGVSHLVYVNEKETGIATVKSFPVETNGKAVERKVPTHLLLDYVNKRLKCIEDTSSSGVLFNSMKPTPVSPAVSETSLSQSTHQHAGTRQLNVELVAPEKLAFNTKKRYEYEVRTKLSSLPFLAHVSSKARICAIASDLPSAVLKSLSAALDVRNSEEEFNFSLAEFSRTVPRHKKYLLAVGERISDAVFQQQVPFIVLYSYKDDGFCLVI